MVYSADGIPRAEALSAHKRLSALLRFKSSQEYSGLYGFGRARISLAILRFNIITLHGPQEKEVREQK